MVDILVLGATGFTGRLITAYLKDHPERDKFTFAIAGRSKEKLNELKRGLSLPDSVQVFTLDVTHAGHVDEVVQVAQVIISTVGPYWKYGNPVVRACARHGKRYVDLAGEPHWLKDMIVECDYAASKTHAVIVPCTGIDSLPSDMAVYLSNKTLKTLAGPDINIDKSVSSFRLKGSLSGGTFQTLFTILEEVPRHKLQASGEDFALCPSIKGVKQPPQKLLYSLPFSSPPVYGSFFMMSGINRQIVQRSWALNEIEASESTSKDVQARAYGPRFKYDEFLVMPNKVTSVIMSLGLAFTMLFMMIPPIRWLAKRLVPQPGEGPSEQQLRDGFVHVTNVTSSVPTASRVSTHVRTTIKGQGDPGYALTAVMISECALSFLLNANELPPITREGGILTPSTAFGDVIVKRLEASGKFSFESEVILGPGEESRKTR